jgi:hypothetical protein
MKVIRAYEVTLRVALHEGGSTIPLKTVWLEPPSREELIQKIREDNPEPAAEKWVAAAVKKIEAGEYQVDHFEVFDNR